MASPGCLQLDDEPNLGHQKLRIVALLSSNSLRSDTVESASSFVRHLKSLHLRGLAVHVEFGMFAVLAHAVPAVRLAVAHFAMLATQIQIITNLLPSAPLIQPI